MHSFSTAPTFHCPNCDVTGPAYYANCPNCGCDYLETTSGYDSGFAGGYDGYHAHDHSHSHSHDAYNEYDARNDGYPGVY